MMTLTLQEGKQNLHSITTLDFIRNINIG